MTDDYVWCVGISTSMIAILTAERSFGPQRELANDIWAMGFERTWGRHFGPRGSEMRKLWHRCIASDANISQLRWMLISQRIKTNQ
jgi:hypothetical protein